MGAFLFPLVLAMFSLRANCLDTEDAAAIKMHPKNVEPCECDGECILDLKNIVMTIKDEDTMTFAADMTIKDNSCSKLGGEVALKYCDHDGSNCMKQPSLQVDNFCGHMSDKGTMWQPLIEKMEENSFVAECPVKGGSYKLKNVNVDMSPIKKFQPEPGRWWGTLMAKCEDKKIFCMSTELVVEALGGLKK